MKLMHQEKSVFVSRYRKNSSYHTRYEGNLLTKREINKVLVKLIVKENNLKRIRTLQSQRNYHEITACAVDNLSSLEREAKNAAKIKDPGASEFWQLIEKLKLAKAKAKERMEAGRQTMSMFRKTLEQKIQANTRSSQEVTVRTAPIWRRVAPKRVPKEVPGTIIGPRAGIGKKLAPRLLFKDCTYILKSKDRNRHVW